MNQPFSGKERTMSRTTRATVQLSIKKNVSMTSINKQLDHQYKCSPVLTKHCYDSEMLHESEAQVATFKLRDRYILHISLSPQTAFFFLHELFHYHDSLST